MLCSRLGLVAFSSIAVRATGSVVRRTMADASTGRRQAAELVCDDDSSFQRVAKKMKAISSQDPDFAPIDPEVLPGGDEEGKEQSIGEVLMEEEREQSKAEDVSNEEEREECIVPEAEKKNEQDEDPSEDQEGSNRDASNGKPLSKSAQKRLLKLEKLAARKKEMKARDKERKKEKKEQKSRDWATLSAEEREAAIQRSKEASAARAEEGKKRREKLSKALEAGQNLVIDFQFTDQMTDQEIANMSQQIMYCYAANARASIPVRLSLTSLGRMKQSLERVPGYSNWMLHREESSYVEVFESRSKDLVYLTADSETVLESLEESKIYIIGGMVDHNRLKCLTLNRAKEQGIATARLPIQENIKLTSSTVLTVNQVFEIVLAYLESKDWAKALRSIIPQRKVAQ